MSHVHSLLGELNVTVQSEVADHLREHAQHRRHCRTLDRSSGSAPTLATMVSAAYTLCCRKATTNAVDSFPPKPAIGTAF